MDTTKYIKLATEHKALLDWTIIDYGDRIEIRSLLFTHVQFFDIRATTRYESCYYYLCAEKNQVIIVIKPEQHNDKAS